MVFSAVFSSAPTSAKREGSQRPRKWPPDVKALLRQSSGQKAYEEMGDFRVVGSFRPVLLGIEVVAILVRALAATSCTCAI